MNWQYKDFEDYLIEVCMKENPTVLDDESVEFYNEWLCDLEPDDFIKYANKYAEIKKDEK